MQEANRYLPTLKAHLGNDVQFVIEDGKYDIPDLDEETIMERLANFEDNPMFKTYGPSAEYTYQHPEYPEVLQLTTPDWFYEELNKPDNSISLKDELVKRILELPYNLVRENLERIILYHIGQTCEGVPEDIEEDDFTGIIANSVILLGEVGNADSSLDVVLELLRQNDDFFHYQFGDAGADIFVPTLYLLGQNRLDRLTDFVKEEGLDTHCKSYVFTGITQIALHQTDRRDEILRWYREMIRFAIQKLPETQWFDCDLAAFLVCELIDLQAKELLPDIQDLFGTGLVSLGICGDYRSVSRDIVDPRCAGLAENCILDVRERFADMRRTWGK